ncbi:MAG: VWA domain-containing protein [Alphaproteobacteria bacterium]|nr:VWA domain-containing protein [Alphaproteobacteria bacterium]
MRSLPLVIVLAAVGASPLPRAAVAAPGATVLPPVVVREACFASRHDEPLMQKGFGSGGGGAYGGAAVGGSVTRGRSTASPPPPSAPRPAPRAEAPEAEPAAAMDADADAFDAFGDGARRLGTPRPDEPAPRTEARPWPAGPRVDWGGVTWLSNDDSMSLASAQRLVYALERHVPIDLGEIRPHELLNWVHFDTVAPRGSELFGVHAVAERTGADSLALTMTLRAATPPRPDADLTLLVDRSGSMRADGRMDYTKRALHQMAGQLRHGDRVDLVVFDHEVCTPLENFVVGRDDPALLRRIVDRMAPRGSTDLDRGLRSAYQVARQHTEAGRSSRVMVFTDALLNTGDVDPHTVTEVGRALDEQGIRLTGVGVGRDFRDDVLDRLTEKGKGAYVFLGDERMVDRLFGQGFDGLIHTVGHDVRFSLDLPPSLGLTRFYGEEASTVAEDVQPVHVHAGSVQTFFQDLAIRDGRLQPGEPLTLDVSWDDPTTGRRHGQRVTFSVADALARDPHNVHKAQALMAWADVVRETATSGDVCGEAFGRLQTARARLPQDAEIAYLGDLVGTHCPREPVVVARPYPHRVATRVRLDSDEPISEVQLACADGTHRQTLTAGTSVTRFDVPAGGCELTLHGLMPLRTHLDVPSTGVDVRCAVRSGRLDCR